MVGGVEMALSALGISGARRGVKAFDGRTQARSASWPGEKFFGYEVQ
ncbi:hypothetical protein C4K04_1712 [Pseudomonas chlororaphis]|uniref:Uncharacterized protein n=1 Tax=Pseudomonas chlororaphis TaxID=587753 RepID=A0A3G7TK74_9PSED|nr:hypothetical protein C4K04_1712 [Pseudomonas chlororaphis]